VRYLLRGLVYLVMVAGLWAWAVDISGPNIEAHIFQGKDGRSLPYRLFKPVGYDPAKKYPLVLCLHGAGGRGSENMSHGTQAFETLADPAVQAQHPCFLLTPQCPDGKRWVATNWGKGSYSLDATPITPEMQSVLDILALVRTQFNVDPARVYVTGQSMGGYGTWNILMLHPEIFAAAIPVCGAGDPSKAKELVSMPIWMFHGSDDPTVPVTGSRDMNQALLAAGSKVCKYTEFPGVQHGSWIPAWKDPGLIPWLFAQHK
jgi:predicted peptidase